MVRAALLLTLLASPLPADVVFRAQPTASKPLRCSLAVPEGWTVHQDRKSMLVIGPNAGFKVTFEHLFRDPKEFADTWKQELLAGGIKSDVKQLKAGSHKAYHAWWEAGERNVEVFRIHVPETEMLYNLSFSAAKDTELKPLVDGVLDSFRCTAPAEELEFESPPVSDGRLSFRLPKGFRKEEGRFPVYVKLLPGSKEPHPAGHLSVVTMDLNTRIQMPDGSILDATDVEGLLEASWREMQQGLGKVTRKPKVKGAYFGRAKGKSLYAAALTPQGLPKSFFGFACKHKGYTYVVRMLVDEREERLHKNYFKRVFSEITIEKG